MLEAIARTIVRVFGRNHPQTWHLRPNAMWRIARFVTEQAPSKLDLAAAARILGSGKPFSARHA